MRFKTDENLPIEVAELLRQNQHDARSVPERQMAGQTDVQVARVCRSDPAVVGVADLLAAKEFGRVCDRMCRSAVLPRAKRDRPGDGVT